MTEDKTMVLHTGGDFLVPAAAIQTVLATYQAKKDFIGSVLCEGVDYGKIPGSGDKHALLKPGAEKMATFFGLAPLFEDMVTIEDWTGAEHAGEQFFYYRQKCKLFRGDRLIASADGSCNSWEKKYRYRNASRVCPKCGKATIIAGKKEYGGGWLCFTKKGGCNAKFQDGDKTIEGQTIGEVKNPDVAEQVNTILKMAQKRALVAAVLIATNASDYFTQDIEDFAVNTEFVDAQVIENQPKSAKNVAPEQRSEAQTVNVDGNAAVVENGAQWTKTDDHHAYTGRTAKIGKHQYPTAWAPELMSTFVATGQVEIFHLDGILDKLQMPFESSAADVVAKVTEYLAAKQ